MCTLGTPTVDGGVLIGGGIVTGGVVAGGVVTGGVVTGGAAPLSPKKAMTKTDCQWGISRALRLTELTNLDRPRFEGYAAGPVP